MSARREFGLRPLPSPEPPEGFGRLSLGRWFTVTGAIIAVLLLAGLAWTATTLGDAHTARDTVIEVIDPAALKAAEVATALSAQEGAVRSYALTQDDGYLTGYRDAINGERAALSQLSGLLRRLTGVSSLQVKLDVLQTAAGAWRREYADPILADVPAKGADALTRERVSVNQRRFGEVRDSLADIQRQLERLHQVGADAAREGANAFYLALAGLVAAMLLTLVILAFIVRYIVLRPVAELAGQVRAVAAGDFDHRLQVERPAELAELSSHVDAMRGRMLSEWQSATDARNRLEDQTAELRRSNGELEQFAYVASHDLQEPLRKVASFTQMLEQRYGDQLDDRAKQYIAFAVDGAKRMQLLINDLLDFSRVGRVGGERRLTDSGDAVRAALRNLTATLEDAEATVEHHDLPQVYGNPLLLTQLFQNLIGNAVKFRAAEPPVIEIGARQVGDMWEFHCTDNGIGVEAKYTDRIFLIFQRLHPRDVYPGTGIGLALCRKIVEYHGGTIWVDNDPKLDKPGTTFRWTLPASGETDG
ncbi:ATP-binding protein [Streptosporangium soli]|nr:ATP-binding protein [Streptosporangium sp. KLBMP 9127]